jgi:hypothetical protein
MIIEEPRDAAKLKSGLISAACGYLRAAPLALNVEVIRAELIELLNDPITAEVAKVCIASADPGIIQHLIDRNVDFATIHQGISDPAGIFKIMHHPHIEPARKRHLFELLSCKVPNTSRRTEINVAQSALLGEYDLELFDKICAWAVHTRPTEMILGGSNSISQSVQHNNPDFWVSIASRIDRDDPSINKFALRALKYASVRVIAVLIHHGVDLKESSVEAQNFIRHREFINVWHKPLVAQITSNHGALYLHARMPTLRQIFEMPPHLLGIKLSGLSKRQRIAILRKSRQQRFPLPSQNLEDASGGVV